MEYETPASVCHSLWPYISHSVIVDNYRMQVNLKKKVIVKAFAG